MKIRHLAVALGLALPLAATADIDYGYLELDHASMALEGDVDADGFGLRGSLPFNDSWYGILNYADLTTDTAVETDITGTSLGLGWHTEIAADVDFLAELTYEDVDIGDLGDDGFGVKGGVRGLLTDHFELDGYVRHVSMEESDTLIGVAAAWNFTGAWLVVLGFESGDADTLALGIRYGF